MKKDRFDEILHRKLEEVNVPPSDSVWKRLEGSLAAVRREETFAEEASEPAAGDGVPDYKPNIRRPLRRKMRWAYVAASAAAVFMIIWTLNRFGGEADMADGSTKDNVVTPENDRPERIVTDIVRQSPATERQKTVESYGRVVAAVTAGDKAAGDGVAAGSGSGRIAAAVHPMDTAKSPADSGEEAKKEPEDTKAASDGNTGKDKAKKTSDRKDHGGFAVLTHANAEYDGRQRRTTPVAASLFAVNTGGIAGGGDVKGGTVMSASSLIVNEKGEGPVGYTDLSSATVASKLKHDMPLTFGISVSVGLVRNLSIQTGVNYTYMKSEAESSADWDYSVKQRLHYIGVPVAVKYDFFTNKNFDFYVTAGGALEKCVSGEQTIRISGGGQTSEPDRVSLNVKGVQASVGASVGGEVNIDKTFGVYVEPGIGYFFKNSKQPESYRTENPLNFTFRAGLRINL